MNNNLKKPLMVSAQISTKIIATGVFTVLGTVLGFIIGLTGLSLVVYPSVHWFFIHILADGDSGGWITYSTVGAFFGSILFSSLAFYMVEKLFKVTREYTRIIVPSLIITFLIIDIFPQTWFAKYDSFEYWTYAIYPVILLVLSLIPFIAPSKKRELPTQEKPINKNNISITKKINTQLIFTMFATSAFHFIFLMIAIKIWNIPKFKPLFNYDEIELITIPFGAFLGLISGLLITDKILKITRTYWKIVGLIVLFFLLITIPMTFIWDLQTTQATILLLGGPIVAIILAQILPSKLK